LYLNITINLEVIQHLMLRKIKLSRYILKKIEAIYFINRLCQFVSMCEKKVLRLIINQRYILVFRNSFSFTFLTIFVCNKNVTFKGEAFLNRFCEFNQRTFSLNSIIQSTTKIALNYVSKFIYSHSKNGRELHIS
jgi:hypothetical protein